MCPQYNNLAATQSISCAVELWDSGVCAYTYHKPQAGMISLKSHSCYTDLFAQLENTQKYTHTRTQKSSLWHNTIQLRFGHFLGF